MTIGLVFLALIMATVVWWLIRTTFNAKPWEAAMGTEGERDPGALPLPPAKVALGSFLAVVTSFFVLLLSAYMMRMELPDWRRLDDPAMLWINTVVLLFASVAFQKAVGDFRRERKLPGRLSLLAGGLLSIAFLAGQYLVWQRLNAEGYYAASNPAYAFFYLATGLHGLHLAGGLWVWVRTSAQAFRGAGARRLLPSIELCTAYWHFLLLVWAGLFILLLTT